jgi:hypothetical protein
MILTQQRRITLQKNIITIVILVQEHCPHQKYTSRGNIKLSSGGTTSQAGSVATESMHMLLESEAITTFTDSSHSSWLVALRVTCQEVPYGSLWCVCSVIASGICVNGKAQRNNATGTSFVEFYLTPSKVTWLIIIKKIFGCTSQLTTASVV